MTRTITGTIEHRGRGNAPTVNDVIAMFEEAQGTHGIPDDAELAMFTIDPAKFGEWRVSINYRVPWATGEQRDHDRLRDLMRLLDQHGRPEIWRGWGALEHVVCLRSDCVTNQPCPHPRADACPPPRGLAGDAYCPQADHEYHVPNAHYWTDANLTTQIWRCPGRVSGSEPGTGSLG